MRLRVSFWVCLVFLGCHRAVAADSGAGTGGSGRPGGHVARPRSVLLRRSHRNHSAGRSAPVSPERRHRPRRRHDAGRRQLRLHVHISRQTRPWNLYVGGGPTINWYDFDDGSDTEGGFNFIVGAKESRRPVLRAEGRNRGQPRPEIRRWVYLQIGSQGEPLRLDRFSPQMNIANGGRRAQRNMRASPASTRASATPAWLRLRRIALTALARVSEPALTRLAASPFRLRRSSRWPSGTTASFARSTAPTRAIDFYEHGIARLEDRWQASGRTGHAFSRRGSSLRARSRHLRPGVAVSTALARPYSSR